MSDTLDQWPEVLMNNYGTPPLELVSGHGATVTDGQGRQFIDMLAGIAVNALGHGHPAIVEAVSEQIRQLGHTSNLFAHAPVVKLASRLKNLLGAGESTRIFFCNSGAEANETAFKLSRLSGRSRILAAVHGFHGRTMGSLAMTGQPEKRAPFEPMPAGVEFYDYGDLDNLRALVEQAPADTASIILEPIQGETGVIPAPAGFLRAVRELCDEHGILMIVDEVQTGVGRTGDFFAHQHEGIIPDVVTMAKGLGGGLPIGACLATGKAAELFGPGSHGTTFGGNPVACAAANAVLNVVDEEFCREVRAKGEHLKDELSQLDEVVEVRGRGLMLGIVLRQPFAGQMVREGLERGLILNAPAADVIRLTPPLVINEAETATALAGLKSLITDIAGRQSDTEEK